MEPKVQGITPKNQPSTQIINVKKGNTIKSYWRRLFPRQPHCGSFLPTCVLLPLPSPGITKRQHWILYSGAPSIYSSIQYLCCVVFLWVPRWSLVYIAVNHDLQCYTRLFTLNYQSLNRGCRRSCVLSCCSAGDLAP